MTSLHSMSKYLKTLHERALWVFTKQVLLHKCKMQSWEWTLSWLSWNASIQLLGTCCLQHFLIHLREATILYALTRKVIFEELHWVKGELLKMKCTRNETLMCTRNETLTQHWNTSDCMCSEMEELEWFDSVQTKISGVYMEEQLPTSEVNMLTWIQPKVRRPSSSCLKNSSSSFWA